ncbi:MAG: ornithine cyclodeaminase family protein [Candidatus Aminicenantes bacterium]|nr:ornithine cyclodeaminase family protein [Candidatus Aminicenantes bacterium]
MAKVFHLEQIKAVLKKIDPVQEIEKGFVAYSRGEVVVPPIGEMIFEDPPGDTHIKYGYIKKDDYFVIKIASGFLENSKTGLPSGSGMMLLFSQKTGYPEAVLFDEGYLTDVRTAAAGAVAAKYLAPKQVERIGIFGAGIQGRMQLEYLKTVTPCREVVAWGLNREELAAYQKDAAALGFSVQTTLEAAEVAAACNLIVTCTPATAPLLKADQIRKGTHITAMGSDTALKQELDAGILEKADRVVADSISQVMERGESFKAMQAGAIKKEDLLELGNVIIDRSLQRASEDEITVADLTGVAVQDIQITKAVYKKLVTFNQKF